MILEKGQRQQHTHTQHINIPVRRNVPKALLLRHAATTKATYTADSADATDTADAGA
jgi:hypothetical protein